MMKKSVLTMLALCSAIAGAAEKASTRELGYTEYYLKEFEAEVKRAQGNANTMFRNKNEALTRIQALMKKYPEDPAVLALYERARTALMMSKGDYNQITPAMVAYLNNEKQLREKYAQRCIRIPMLGEVRSLNLANSVAILCYEALRQQGFPGLSGEGEMLIK